MRLQPLAVCRPPSLSSTSRLPSRIEPARSPCRKYDQADSLPQRPFLGRSCQAVPLWACAAITPCNEAFCTEYGVHTP